MKRKYNQMSYASKWDLYAIKSLNWYYLSKHSDSNLSKIIRKEKKEWANQEYLPMRMCHRYIHRSRVFFDFEHSFLCNKIGANYISLLLFAKLFHIISCNCTTRHVSRIRPRSSVCMWIRGVQQIFPILALPARIPSTLSPDFYT